MPPTYQADKQIFILNHYKNQQTLINLILNQIGEHSLTTYKLNIKSKMNRMSRLLAGMLFILQIFVQNGCKSIPQEIEFFNGKYAGYPEAETVGKEVILKNKAIKAVWVLKDNSIQLKELENGYDNSKLDLEKIVLFEIEQDNGKRFTNFDFKLQGELKTVILKPTDSLPTMALRSEGKQITGDFISTDHNISIQWSALLREGSNYIKQSIKITVKETPVQISKVVFFDGDLKGATYAGSVLGSPIVLDNFFFGLEHPIAHSKALFSRSLGGITFKEIDISDLINSGGKYVVVFQHGGGSDDFNIKAISLLEDTVEISRDEHILNGYKGSNLYTLNLENYSQTSTYKIKVDLVNKEKANGRLHIYKKRDNLLNFYVNRADELRPNTSISESSVMGVSPPGQNRRAFGYYLAQERARPYKQFLHYNCWWDITDDGASSFTSEQLIERMQAWNEKFIKPFDIKLDAFVFDDGWDDLDSVWYFDPIKFPEGFAPQAKLCKEYNSGIGVWMSPFGGYLNNKRRRIRSAHREGLETNNKGLSLAGINYYNRFKDRALDMLNNYEVNYFKFDGFGGSEPEYLPDMEAGAKLIEALRQDNPDVYVNITVGSWPSPFWLKYADCIWRGSGDLNNAGVGSITQKFMTYRDGTLHNNIVNRAPLYPLNSIMTAGIAYANLGHPSRFINDDPDDFKAMIRSSFGAGSSLQELYISHDRMKDAFWPVLAEAAKWSDENEELLEDTHWIGGSPINLEVYGFASWKPGRGVITLRNPSNKTVVYNLDFGNDLELPRGYSSTFRLKSPWKEDESKKSMSTNSESILEIEMKPFEVLVFEVSEEPNNQ